jgi:4-aminobutyrate aminotransferase
MKIKSGVKPAASPSLEIIERDKKVISPSLTREAPLVFSRAAGSYIWDVEGKRYLDFAAAVAVMNSGHSNPAVAKAVRDQLRSGAHMGFSDFYAEKPVEFIEYLLTLLPKRLNKAFLSNSGTESVEAAYKLARWHTRKKWVVAFKPSFHGRTMGSLSLTNARRVQKERFDPFLPVKHATYPNCYRCLFQKKSHDGCVDLYLDELEKTIKSCDGNVAAVIMEPIAGEPGYLVPPKEFVQGVRRLCDDHGLLLIADEVQSGCYRTGTFLAMENFDVQPDIVCLSKAVGGGLPLGVTIASSSVMDWTPGTHANTLGGNLIACAAGLANLKFMNEQQLGERAKKTGGFILKALLEMKERYEIIGDVRGIGLMIGIEIVKDKKSKQPGTKERSYILSKTFDNGLVLLPAGESTIRICPPLILTRSQARHGLDILEAAIKDASKG